MHSIYVADLTHTAQGVSAPTFPLGAAFIAAHAKAQLGPEFGVTLFKYPTELATALADAPPTVLAFSNYSWNFELAYRVAELAKQRAPSLITVFGGPNFPTLADEKRDFLEARPAIDFYIELEGEVAFVELVRALHARGFDASRVRAEALCLANTCYLAKGALVAGPAERIADVNAIPSPYLDGTLDEFFERALVPMLETTRGCPFACTFCADGLPSKNRIARFAPERTHAELEYIASRLRGVDELIITDLNFAMYPQDVETAKVVADVRARTGWPVVLSASAGKNKPQRTIEVASILKGAWTLGASLQSTDDEVLVAIKRKNISKSAYKALIDYGASLENAKTHSEIILGLPGDTREKHYESLRFGVESGVTAMRMFQAMLLRGTEMADAPTRRRYGLQTRFRTIPGCVGVYELLGERCPIAEIEEIIVGSDSLPFEDYLDCRVMNLVIETFYNNALMEELWGLCGVLGVSVFDCLLRVKERSDRWSPTIGRIVDEFVRQTSADLFETYEEAKSVVLTPEVIEKYVGGELGINELLVHKALLFSEFEEIASLVFEAARDVLAGAGVLDERIEDYLGELRRYVLLRKRGCVTNTDAVLVDRFHYDFERIHQLGYRIDPRGIERFDEPRRWSFRHTRDQSQHIANQWRIYKETSIGLGRLLQRSNLRRMYRVASPEDEALRSVEHAKRS